MTIQHAAHYVTKVTVTSEQHFQSNGRDCISRELRITFADGTEQRIDLYADASVENLTVEIK